MTVQIYTTSNIVQEVTKLSYSDPLSGGSPDIEIVVCDRGSIPIAPKSNLTVEFGYSNEPYRLRAGIFEIDKVGRDRGLWTIAGTGLPLSDPQLKVKRDDDFSESSLQEILKEIADRYSLTVFAPNIPKIVFSQLQQTQQTDLEFLNDLAGRVGAVFKFENQNLIFTPVLELEKKPPIFQLNRKELMGYSEEITSTQTYQYLDYEVMLFGDVERIRVEDDRVSNGKITTYRGGGVTADDEQLLMIAAKEKLRQINGENHKFTIQIQGNPSLIAGSTFTLNDKLAMCDRAVHAIENNIWLATLTARFLP